MRRICLLLLAALATVGAGAVPAAATHEADPTWCVDGHRERTPIEDHTVKGFEVWIDPAGYVGLGGLGSSTAVSRYVEVDVTNAQKPTLEVYAENRLSPVPISRDQKTQAHVDPSRQCAEVLGTKVV